MALLVKLQAFSFICLVFVAKIFSFESQYLGNYLSEDEYKAREVCSTKVCMRDDDRLIYSATHTSDVQPCDDFRTFAMGEFNKYRVLNDRYQFLGFDNSIDRLHKERQRKLLEKRVKESDPKYVKVLKNFYSKCVNTKDVDQAGVNDILSYLADIVGSPVFSTDAWDDQKFKLKSLFDHEFDHTMSLISSDSFNPHVYSSPLCDENSYWMPGSDWQKDFKDILRKLKVSKNETISAIADFNRFLETKDEIIIASGFAGNKVAIEGVRDNATFFTPALIKTLYTVYPPLEKHKFANISEIFSLYKDRFTTPEYKALTEYRNDTIRQPAFTFRLMEFLELSDKRLLANNFALSFLFVQRKSFITHAFTKQEAAESGTTRSLQRFEQCIAILESEMQPAMQAMFATNFFNEKTQKAAKQLVLDAIADVRSATENTDLIKKADSEEFSWRLQHMEPIVMFHEDILNQSFVEDIYRDLQFNDSQNLFMMTNVLKNFHEKAAKTRWFRDFEECCDKDDIFSKQDLPYSTPLYIPAKFTLYPYFHQHRSSFFNMATLYDRAVLRLSEGIFKYMGNLQRLASGITFSDVYDVTSMAVARYDSWLKAGNQELQLSAFKLTNLQMYWLCLAHRKTLKFHKNVPEKFFKQERLESEYLHVRFKNRTSFRDAFNCGDMTDNERLQLQEFTKKEDKSVAYSRCSVGPAGESYCLNAAYAPYPKH